MRKLLSVCVVLAIATAAYAVTVHRGQHIFNSLDIRSTLKIDGTQVTATASELNTVDVTAGTATASKALVLDSNLDVATVSSITADQFRVTNGTALSAANPQLTKSQLQNAGFFSVDTSSNAVQVDLFEDAVADSDDVGVSKWFVVTTGHATQALTVASGTAFSTVTSLNTLGTSCEDAGDAIQCIVTATNTATCLTYCADS